MEMGTLMGHVTRRSSVSILSMMIETTQKRVAVPLWHPFEGGPRIPLLVFELNRPHALLVLSK